MRAYLDWALFGELPKPLWQLPADVADELRYIAAVMPLPGPWLNGFRKAR